ncbi:MAG: hypothetical protein OXU31_05930 [Gammaproteobacteria bacterium]|nr:hypothetical protein [Gammaproteobacteria bacterium]MDD9815502.1 hypothetical protein [Gammaproteobacteria bacterium]MDD9850330.1 hypothetical protein [Gammaproteobacteria bacterium]
MAVQKNYQAIGKARLEKEKGGGKGSHTKMVKPGRTDPIIKHNSQIATWIVKD